MYVHTYTDTYCTTNTYIEPRKISTLELLGVCMRFCAKKKKQDSLGAGGFIGL